MTHQRASVFIGLDLGTSSVKALAVDERGRTLAVEREPYETQRPSVGWAEQCPDDWWSASARALRRLTTRQELANAAVEALGLSGQMHGAVLLDGDGNPLGNAITWADERGGPEVANVAARLPGQRFARVTGSAPYASATLAKLLWLQAHAPDTYARAARVVLAKDDIRRRLIEQVATDPSDASGTLLFDVAGRVWSSEIVEAAGVRASLLPDVVPSDAIAGCLSATAATVTGLVPGLPVATGGGDAACAALGAGMTIGTDGARTGLLSLGTAGQLGVLAAVPAIDPSARTQTLCAVADDVWLVMGAILAGGLAVEWLAAVTGTKDAWALLDEAALVPAGADGLIFVPHLAGARTPNMDLQARGAFVGLGIAHGRGHLARAVVEGVAFALRDCLEVLGEMGLRPDELLGAGGPLHHALWQRTLADVLRLPLRMREQQHGSAVGAALLGMRAVGAWPGASGIEQVATQRRMPDGQRADMYERLFELYRGTYPALRTTMHRLLGGPETGDVTTDDGA